MAAIEPPIRVLVVEDGEIDRRRVVKMLSRTGPVAFQVLEANSAAQAIDLLRQRRVDVILLDLGLPDVASEFDGLKRIARVAGPIVVVTSEEDRQEIAAEAARLGAEDCLFKGELSTERLSRALMGAVNRVRYRMGSAVVEPGRGAPP
jgi:DNA-binding NarL/FixJ family response regulator